MATTGQVKKAPNPTGKGGFGDNPQNINPGGEPKNSLKSYVALKLSKMTDEEKDEYLEAISNSEQWKMAEGSPHQTQDQKIEVTLPQPLLAGKSHGNNNNSNKEATETQEED